MQAWVFGLLISCVGVGSMLGCAQTSAPSDSVCLSMQKTDANALSTHSLFNRVMVTNMNVSRSQVVHPFGTGYRGGAHLRRVGLEPLATGQRGRWQEPGRQRQYGPRHHPDPALVAKLALASRHILSAALVAVILRQGAALQRLVRKSRKGLGNEVRLGRMLRLQRMRDGLRRIVRPTKSRTPGLL